MGTSPHARGPPIQCIEQCLRIGNIPACAGTTFVSSIASIHIWEHPRMRGDHRCARRQEAYQPGTSPHARGPLTQEDEALAELGNIPACAGTTDAEDPGQDGCGEHPRMRGDHFMLYLPLDDLMGTSPHARGPLHGPRRSRHLLGNIPACAGTTNNFDYRRWTAGEHPRMRGDHFYNKGTFLFDKGTSPHARGPLYDEADHFIAVGNIPACAGTTRGCENRLLLFREHPRMRGDHLVIA